MFAKKIKFAIAATTLSLSFTQPSFAENLPSYFHFYTVKQDGTKIPIVRVVAAVATVEGQSKDINTRWSGDSGKEGTSKTKSGDFVSWSYFYVDENQTTWGSPNNPDLYIKLWYDHSGRIDVNCFHVSVPDIACGVALLDKNDNVISGSGAIGVATMSDRFVQLRKEPNSNSFYWVGSDGCLRVSRLNTPEEKLFDEQFKTIEVASNQ